MTPGPVKPNFRIRKNPNAFHHGDLREAAVHLAVKEVEDVGHTQVSLEKLASRLGVTRPALYRHFADREALLEAVALHGYLRFEMAMEEAFLSVPDPWKALHACGCAYVRFAMKNPGWFRLQFSRGQTERNDSHLVTRQSDFGPLMYMALVDRFGKENPEINDLFRILWAQAHGLAVFVVERVFRLVKTDAERLAAAENALAVLLEAFHAYSVTKVDRLGLVDRTAAMPGISTALKAPPPKKGEVGGSEK